MNSLIAVIEPNFQIRIALIIEKVKELLHLQAEEVSIYNMMDILANVLRGSRRKILYQMHHVVTRQFRAIEWVSHS